MQPSQNRWVAGHRFERRFGKREQAVGMEAGGKTLQPHRGHLPIAVASRPAQKVDLPLRTLDECCAQLADQLRVMPGSSGEICVERTTFVGHPGTLEAKALRRGLYL